VLPTCEIWIRNLKKKIHCSKSRDVFLDAYCRRLSSHIHSKILHKVEFLWPVLYTEQHFPAERNRLWGRDIYNIEKDLK
jgi:hypothetical protein